MTNTKKTERKNSPLKCKVCRKERFWKEKEWQEHVIKCAKSRMMQKSIECTLCGYDCVKPCKMKRHCKRAHGTDDYLGAERKQEDTSADDLESMDPGPLSEFTGDGIEEDLTVSDSDDTATNEDPIKEHDKEDERRSRNDEHEVKSGPVYRKRTSPLPLSMYTTKRPKLPDQLFKLGSKELTPVHSTETDDKEQDSGRTLREPQCSTLVKVSTAVDAKPETMDVSTQTDQVNRKTLKKNREIQTGRKACDGN